MTYLPPQNIFITQDPWGERNRPGQWGMPGGPSTGPYNPSAGTMPVPGGSNTQASGNGGGSVIDRLLGNSEGWGDIASVAGAFSSGKKADRVVEGNFRGDYDRMMLDREYNMNRLGVDRERFMNAFGLEAQDARNRNESDALKKLQQTAYIKGGAGGNFQAPTIELGGQTRTAPSFAGIAPQAATAEEIQGASALQGQLMDRFGDSGSFTPKWDFTPNWSYTPTPVDAYARPGMAEQIGSYVGTGAGIIGALGKIFGGEGAGAGGAGGSVPGIGGNAISRIMGGGMGKAGNVLGKLAPYAGAATGTIGLLKDRGTGANVMNGATAGAGYGTMIAPGIGTAVGAGIGALAGWARGLGGPSEQEVAGREVAAQGRQAITSGATPQQIQEAHSSGWNNPQDALALIVIRDALARAGRGPDEANQLMSQLHRAEKGGPQAVEQMLAQIMNTVQSGRA